MLSLIKKCQGYDDAAALLATQKGYVEIIGEGKIVHLPTDKTKCLSAPLVSIPGRTLYNLTPTACVGDILDITPVLEGKVYYVTLDPADFSVQRNSYLNAEALDDILPPFGGVGPHALKGVIVHADTYAAEQARCAVDAGCFAFVDASLVIPVNGASDQNICFYTNPSGAVAPAGTINRFGAAASFGPMISDLNIRRDGTLLTTATALNQLAFNYSVFNGTIDMSNSTAFFPIFKGKADTHYFYVPAPAYSLDMAVKVAFIFPFQHYIAESNAIAITEVYDTEENTTTISLSKFISPGLPTVSTPGQEAQIFTFTPPFPEGWVSFTPSATNGTCAVTDADDTRCALSVPPATSPYLPGYTGAVFTSGDGSLGSSHMHYRP